MKTIPYRLICPASRPEGRIPLSIALIDRDPIRAAGIAEDHAIRLIAREVAGPVGVNVFARDAVTTTSDGIAVPGAIVRMGAGDYGRVHREFGILPMAEMPITPDLVAEEPHLRQLGELYPGRPLYRGPDPATKLVPVHNAVMSGRAVNNNSATEMMNVVTMEEILLPILGQLQLLNGGDILFGPTGEHISVGIGMTVAEKYGRVFPHRQFKAGETAHGSGPYARTLKRSIPCIVAPKHVLAKHIIDALKLGLLPGRHLGCSPAVLALAKALGYPIARESITAGAKEELASVGVGEEFFADPTDPITEQEALHRADEIVPGAAGCTRLRAEELSEERILGVETDG